MKQLIMNSKAIYTYKDFCDYFSAEDALYNKELVAGFLYYKARHLSLLNLYNSEVFLQVVLSPEEKTAYCPVKKSSDFEKAEFVLDAYFGSEKRRNFLCHYFKESKIESLEEKTWKISQGTNLKDPDKQALFYLLTAAYSAAGRSPDEDGFSITSQEAENAYLNKKPVSEQEEEFFVLTEKETQDLVAREEPYKIILKKKAAQKLLEEKKATICFKKILAKPHRQGVTTAFVKIKIYSEDLDHLEKEVSCAPGDYLFINFVKNNIVHVHETKSKSEHCEVERVENSVNFTRDGKTSKIDFSNFEAVAAIAEDRGTGFIVVSTEGIKDRWSTITKQNHDLNDYKAVDFCFFEGYYVYLDPTGKVVTNHKSRTEKRFASINDYLITLEEMKNEN